MFFKQYVKPVTFAFPNDKAGIRTTISSLFKEVVEAKIISIEDLEDIAQSILKEMKK